MPNLIRQAARAVTAPVTTRRSDGYDISHYQTVTDWPAVANQVRLLTHKATEGRSGIDPNFRTAWAQMRRNRIEFRGAYHWIRSDSPVLAQVDNLFRQVGPLLPGEFIQLDWEVTNPTPPAPPIRPVSVAEIEEFCRLADAAFGPDRLIVYSAPWVPGFAEWRSRNPQVPFWLADYRPLAGQIAAAKYGAAILQWSSTYKPPAGIIYSTGVDVNHVYDWKTLERISRPSSPFPPPQPPLPTPEEEVDMTATRIELTDANAVFLGYLDANGVALQIEWTGSGDDPAVTGRLEALGRLNVPKVVRSVADLVNCRLIGRVPTGDARYEWSPANFANRAELEQQLDIARVLGLLGQNRDQLAALDGRVGRIVAALGAAGQA